MVADDRAINKITVASINLQIYVIERKGARTVTAYHCDTNVLKSDTVLYIKIYKRLCF